jgi:hypothetical protein
MLLCASSRSLLRIVAVPETTFGIRFSRAGTQLAVFGGYDGMWDNQPRSFLRLYDVRLGRCLGSQWEWREAVDGSLGQRPGMYVLQVGRNGASNPLRLCTAPYCHRAHGCGCHDWFA